MPRTRAKPLHMPFNEVPVFKWIGDPIPPPPKDRKSADMPHYKSFNLRELTVEIGEFILVKNEDHSENLQECDIARLDRLYEDRSDSTDPYRAEVTWLCRPSQLPPKLRKGHGFEEDGIPQLDDRIDVVVEGRPYSTNISAETIYFKCKVYSVPMSTVPQEYVKRFPSNLKHPNYLLRFKMKGSSNVRDRRNFTLEPYQSREGGPSPLKLSAGQTRSPLKEKSRNMVDVTGISPAKPLSPKLVVPKEYMDALSPQSQNIDLGRKRRRRLSSRGSNSEDTPMKRVKKSTSVQNTPEKPIIPEEQTTNTPRSTRGAARKPDLATPKSANTSVSGNTGRKTRQSESRENTPVVETKRSSRRSIAPATAANGEESTKEISNSLAKKTPARRRVVSTDDFTEVNRETNSGRKLKITCGEKTTKIAPSSKLGDQEIGNLLDDSDSDQDFEIYPKSAKKGARTAKPTTKTPSKGTTKSTSKAKVEKVEVKAEKKASPKKRTRRASMSVVEKAPPVTPVTNNRRKSMAHSETKIKKKLETYSPASSDADSDFQAEADLSDTDEENDSDYEQNNIVKYKSRKNQQAKSKTQVKNILDRKGFTPGVQQRAKPVPASHNPMVEAQSRLHVSAVPDELPCREEEFAEIFGFIEGKLQEGSGGCIYISGVPGTGKTATVKQVMRYLDENKDEYPEFDFFELNGMRLTCPEQIYVEMWKHLSGGEKLSAEASLKRLDERFAKAGPRRNPTVFLVDELDMLCKSRKQTVLYNMFEWPSRPQAKLIIVAIANTMDLPERDMDMRVISRLGFNRLNFDPYNQLQLQMIVSSRLQGLEVFQSDEIELVSRKVASLSGDARRALDICRILAERCEREGKARITHVEVLQVHAEMFRSPKMQYIRSCSKMEQFLLRALVNEFYRTGVEETNLRNITYRMEELCAAEGNEVPSLHCLYNICARLSSQRLILSEDYRKGLETKLSLNVGFEDVNFALRPPKDMD